MAVGSHRTNNNDQWDMALVQAPHYRSYMCNRHGMRDMSSVLVVSCRMHPDMVVAMHCQSSSSDQRGMEVLAASYRVDNRSQRYMARMDSPTLLSHNSYLVYMDYSQ